MFEVCFCFEFVRFDFGSFSKTGGDTASTWVLKHKEHTGAHEDLDKNVHLVIGNDYALAA